MLVSTATYNSTAQSLMDHQQIWMKVIEIS